MNTPTSTLNLNWPSLIVFVRHGESEGNKHGRHHMTQILKKPSHRFALTELGVTQAIQTGKYLDERFGLDTFDAYFASTYQRSQETFELIFKGKQKNNHQITPIIDARINEITRGYGSMLAEEDLLANHPQEIVTLQINGWFHNIPLAGQSCVQIEHIIHSFLAFLREACSNKRVIIVGHGTWINLCCRILTNRSIEETESRHHEQFYVNCGVTVFEKDSTTQQLVLAEENTAAWM